VLAVTACQGSVPTTSSDSINPTALDVDTSSVELATPSTTTIANLDAHDGDLQETPAPTPSTTSEPIPPFDPDAIAASITDNFEDFRLGQNDSWWDYAEQCHFERKYFVAKAANLRAYFTGRSMPLYNLQIEILNITEQAPGIAEATTRILLFGEPVSDPETRYVTWGRGWKRSFRLDCDRRELKAGWQCGEAFGELRGMCVTLWKNTKINEYECDLANPDFFPRLFHLITTSEEFSLNAPKDLRDICGFQQVPRQGTPAPPPSATSEPLPPFDADAVAASTTESFEEFRLGNNDLWPYYAKPCRLEDWDKQSRTWVTHREYAVAEMANLRAYFIDMGMQPYDLQIEILEVTEQAPGIAEATTRILHLGEPISNPGTQDLKLENGAWKTLNCDRRELKAGWRCSEAFGELRGTCLPLWMNYVKDYECDLANPDFFSQLYQLLATSEEFSLNAPANLRAICGSSWDPQQHP
jgi:hypothetical protein